MPITTQGQVYPLQSIQGVGIAQALTIPGNASSFISVGTPADSGVITPTVVPASSPTVLPQANYVYYLLGIIVLLAVLKYASEHEKSDMDPRIAGIGMYNFVVIGIMAMLFNVSAKVIFAKYPVKGISQIVGAA